jgi:hypothetical protein
MWLQVSKSLKCLILMKTTFGGYRRGLYSGGRAGECGGQSVIGEKFAQFGADLKLVVLTPA